MQWHDNATAESGLLGAKQCWSRLREHNATLLEAQSMQSKVGFTLKFSFAQKLDSALNLFVEMAARTFQLNFENSFYGCDAHITRHL